MNRLRELHNFGQSPWYDNIERGLLLSGKLKKMIDEDGITGVTSNPSIFEKAINGSREYNSEIEKLAKEGKATPEIYDELTIWDITKATELLRGVYESSRRSDGFVSIEVSPHLAHDTEGTMADAKRIFQRIGGGNLMIKVPATSEGYGAIRRLIAEGISVNATLIFSQAHYNAVAEAYLQGLKERVKKGLSVDGINSVASFFVSRIDTQVDKLLEEKISNEKDQKKLEALRNLIGKAAVAQAKVIYDAYRKIFSGPQFLDLKKKGANIQRLLFGSTSTKNPAYRDVKYVEEIIGDGTINTLPPVTVDAFREHGVAKATLGKGIDEAQEALTKLQSYGIAVEEVCQKIQADGVQAFIDSYDNLINSLENKRKQFIS